MEYLICACMGYSLGVINPAYFLSKWKHQDITSKGTGNLGTTNTFINFGKGWGCFVLLVDILKAFLVVKVSQYLFPEFILAGAIAGSMAVIGHIFPFYTKFRGGKGIASFAGFVLAADWRCFLLLLAVGCIMAVIVNYGCGVSFSAAVLFPFLYAGILKSIPAFVILSACSTVIIYKHIDNIKKIRKRKEMPIRQFLCTYVLGKG